MKRILTIIITLLIGTGLGAAIAGNNLTPVNVEATDCGVQITYANGTGYWLEY